MHHRIREEERMQLNIYALAKIAIMTTVYMQVVSGSEEGER
jgi:hypothetical protein